MTRTAEVLFPAGADKEFFLFTTVFRTALGLT
jgi:hypothetical protein